MKIGIFVYHFEFIHFKFTLFGWFITKTNWCFRFMAVICSVSRTQFFASPFSFLLEISHFHHIMIFSDLMRDHIWIIYQIPYPESLQAGCANFKYFIIILTFISYLCLIVAYNRFHGLIFPSHFQWTLSYFVAILALSFLFLYYFCCLNVFYY